MKRDEKTFLLGGLGSMVGNAVDFKLHGNDIGNLPVDFEGTPTQYYYAVARNGRPGEHHVMVPLCDINVIYDKDQPQERCTWLLTIKFEGHKATIIAGNAEQLEAFCDDQKRESPYSVPFQPEWAEGKTACGKCDLCYKETPTIGETKGVTLIEATA
jgi:hypothetical protein